MYSSSNLIISVDCEWNDWEEGECSVECGGGTRINTRHEKNKESNGGKECSGLSNFTEACNTEHCPSNSIKHNGKSRR